jgi:hypothetical protein
MDETYKSRQGTKGGQDAGNTDDMTQNSPQDPGTNQGRTGGANSGPAGQTGHTGRSIDEEEGKGRADMLQNPESEDIS